MTEPAAPGKPSRFVVGIDLGTTNCALAWVDTAEPGAPGAAPRIRTFAIPQWTASGSVEDRSLLPSFLYLTAAGEAASALPWGSAGEIAGVYASRRAAEVPDQVVTSAKSWLCHPGVDRLAPILPWVAAGSGAPETEVRRVSPVAASAAYLSHLRDAWNHAHAVDDPGARLEEQDVYLTVPASFDAAARELTRLAAAEAGLDRVHLLEEPQAAVYAWVEAGGDKWREQVRAGDLVLVCDLGGGTTDLSLVTVEDERGQLALRRVAVGDHLLLGGDNMDLALALHVRERLAGAGTRIDAWQLRGLVLSCREAKEALLSATPPESVPLVVLGRGRKLVGGTIKTDLARTDLERILLDGFFPEVGGDARATVDRAAGLSEIGLPYASDPAVTRHLASFLAAQVDAAGGGGAPAVPAPARDAVAALPSVILFNGGVMRAARLRDRVAGILRRWSNEAGAEPPRVLEGVDLEHAVARGAAYFGLSRRGRGVRIRGGTARSYYVGVASAMPAVPGYPPPIKALCVVPFGVEEGSRLPVPGAEFGLLVGQGATFRFFASSTRREDRMGDVLDEWDTGELDELAPLRVELGADAGAAAVSGGAPAVAASTAPAARVPVRLAAHVTEIGTLELWFAPPGEGDRWRLEFNVREGARA
ncbi:MAG: Chaperone protein HscA [Pseudomonadota bacterium]|jgi:hypothetical protein